MIWINAYHSFLSQLNCLGIVVFPLSFSHFLLLCTDLTVISTQIVTFYDMSLFILFSKTLLNINLYYYQVLILHLSIYLPLSSISSSNFYFETYFLSLAFSFNSRELVFNFLLKFLLIKKCSLLQFTVKIDKFDFVFHLSFIVLFFSFSFSIWPISLTMRTFSSVFPYFYSNGL